MKKFSSMILVLALLLPVLAGCDGSASAANQSNSPTVSQNTGSTNTDPAKLTPEEARDIALEHAGFTADQVKFLTTDLDRDDGTLHYDVDFEKDGYDYDYEIDAATGNILKSQKERD